MDIVEMFMIWYVLLFGDRETNTSGVLEQFLSGSPNLYFLLLVDFLRPDVTKGLVVCLSIGRYTQ